MDVAKGALRQDVFYAPCASRKTVFCRIFRLSYQRMHRLKRDYLSQIPAPLPDSPVATERKEYVRELSAEESVSVF